MRWQHGHVRRASDTIASEVPIALRYNDVAHVVMMATPLDLEDFAVGFSLSEAIVNSPGDIEHIEIRNLLEGIEIAMRIPESLAKAIAARSRNLTGRSSCGLCGTQELADVVRHPSPVASGLRIYGDAVLRSFATLESVQPLNAATGAIHAAAWSDCEGNLIAVREDVGRHNALDKLIGAMATPHVDPAQGFCAITSRASYEMVQKAATVGITLLAAISAPTALAIHLAEATGITLIGFARSPGFVVYANGQRIVGIETGALP
ncbi:MAG: formate dehydrogenase accessory sulfurtransferase FdhD [Dokdonella sp.]